jgi:hypothetical protein
MSDKPTRLPQLYIFQAEASLASGDSVGLLQIAASPEAAYTTALPFAPEGRVTGVGQTPKRKRPPDFDAWRIEAPSCRRVASGSHAPHFRPATHQMAPAIDQEPSDLGQPTRDAASSPYRAWLYVSLAGGVGIGRRPRKAAKFLT